MEVARKGLRNCRCCRIDRSKPRKSYLFISSEVNSLSWASSSMSEVVVVTPVLCSALERLTVQIRYPLRGQLQIHLFSSQGLIDGFMCLNMMLPQCVRCCCVSISLSLPGTICVGPVAPPVCLTLRICSKNEVAN